MPSLADSYPFDVNRFYQDFDRISNGARLGLFGAGGMGRYTLARLRGQRPDIAVQCFFDDHKEGSVDGVEVMPLNRLSQIPIDLVLITSSYWRDMEQKLIDLGWESYAIADLLGEHDDYSQSQEILVRGHAISCHTPNRTLSIIAENFESIEAGTLDWIDSIPVGSVFYDVGASNGIFSLYAAIASKCRVVAFEPEAQNFGVLEMNHFLNRDRISHPLLSINMALSSGSGMDQLMILNYMAGSHSKKLASGEPRGQHQSEQVDHAQSILLESLDSMIERYGLPFPEYLKIDVDGAESHVLQGATNTLSDDRLREILIEIGNPDGEGKSIVSTLEGAGFELKERHTINEIIGTQVANVFNLLFVRELT